MKARDLFDAFGRLPESFEEACREAVSSEFIRSFIPSKILDIYSAG